MSLYGNFRGESHLEKIALSTNDLYSIYKNQGIDAVYQIIQKKSGQISGQAFANFVAKLPENVANDIVSNHQISNKIMSRMARYRTGDGFMLPDPTTKKVTTKAAEPKPFSKEMISPESTTDVKALIEDARKESLNVPRTVHKTQHIDTSKAPTPKVEPVIGSGSKTPEVVHTSTPKVEPVIGSGSKTPEVVHTSTPKVEPVIGSGSKSGQKINKKPSYLPYAIGGGIAAAGLGGAYLYNRNKHNSNKR